MGGELMAELWDAQSLLARHDAERARLQRVAREEQAAAAASAERSGTSMTGRQWQAYFAVRELLLGARTIRLRTEPAVMGNAVRVFAMRTRGGQVAAEASVMVGRKELADPALLEDAVLTLVNALQMDVLAASYLARTGALAPPQARRL